MIVGSDATTRQIGTPGTLLGVIDPIEIHEVEDELRADETLLLYTDGLPEAGRSNRPPAEGSLGRLYSQSPGLKLTGLLERIAQEAVDRADGHPRDDIALLAARLGGTTDGSRRLK